MKVCVDCGTELRHGAGTRVMVHMDKPDGGYDRVEMPACRRCALERRGYDCDECGQVHETNQAAYECCIGSTKAPDCRECGRRMEVGAAGYSPAEGQTITWAECECCPIAWGRFTGWELLDGEEPCKHVEHDGGDEGRLIADGGFETAEADWSRQITTKAGLDDLVTDLDVGMHNMWVDVRKEHPGFSGYESVTVDVTVRITANHENGGAQ